MVSGLDGAGQLARRSRTLKRSVGIGAVSLCAALAACNDDKCKTPNRDVTGCSTSSSGHAGGSAYVSGARSGGTEASSSIARGGFGATGSAHGSSGGE